MRCLYGRRAIVRVDSGEHPREPTQQPEWWVHYRSLA
jgi:hypothetical protein